ncbi:hypothetical protein BGY98DRAFT_954083, partial [Russula aff. rugulosa BPL654]
MCLARTPAGRCATRNSLAVRRAPHLYLRLRVRVRRAFNPPQPFYHRFPHPCRSYIGPDMAFIDILSLILSFGIVFSLRFLFPRNIVPLVSTSFEDAVTVLQRAEAINIPYVSEYRANLAILHPQFLQMRTESHRSPNFFQQFYLLFLCGLTWRLYVVKSRVDAIRRKIELAVDERQLAFLSNTNAQNATATALPASAADAGIPMTNVTEPRPPPAAVLSVRLP